MATYSIIHLSQLEGAHRLDAEYYQPEYLDVRRKVQTFETVESFGSLCRTFRKGIFDIEASSYTEDGIPFVRIGDLKNGVIEESDIAHIPEAIHRKEAKTALKRGDVVLSKTAYPAASLVTVDECNVSQDIIAITLDRKARDRVASEYLVAYFNSHFGLRLMEQWFQGNIQQHLALEDAKRILVPIPTPREQAVVVRLFQESQEQRIAAQRLYAQAEQLLLRELGLDEPEQSEPISWVVKFSDVRTAARCDAEYFQPKYGSLAMSLQQHPHAQLGDLVELLGHATQSEYVEDGDIAVLAQKHMESGLVIETATFDHFTNAAKIKSSDQRFIVKDGDVLVSSAGEPGKTCVWNEPYARKVIPGSFVTVIRTSRVDPFYLGVFLNSPAGKMQFRKLSAASVQQYVYPRQMRSIIVPLLPERIQQKIRNFVQESHAARIRAKQLFEEAKKKVEQLIEQSSGGFNE